MYRHNSWPQPLLICKRTTAGTITRSYSVLVMPRRSTTSGTVIFFLDNNQCWQHTKLWFYQYNSFQCHPVAQHSLARCVSQWLHVPSNTWNPIEPQAILAELVLHASIPCRQWQTCDWYPHKVNGNKITIKNYKLFPSSDNTAWF